MSEPYRVESGAWKYTILLCGKRPTFHLGHDPKKKFITETRRLIDMLAAAKRSGKPPSSLLVESVRKLPADVQESISRQGVFDLYTISGIGLGKLIESFESSQPHLIGSDNYERTKIRLAEWFNFDRVAESITVTDAAAFFEYLAKDRTPRLKRTTINMNWKYYRRIFSYGQTAELVGVNPFSKISINPSDRTPSEYVKRELIHRVMSYCRSPELRLVLAFARYAGFRIPSEIRDLKWSEISETEIMIRTGKTGCRAFPMVSDLARELELYRRSVPMGEYVFPEVRQHVRSCLASRLEHVLHVAKADRWPKLFNSLRASCITEYVHGGVHASVLDAIFGNSDAIRKKFYIKIREEDRVRIAGMSFGPKRSPWDLPLLSADDIAGLSLSCYNGNVPTE